MMIKSLWIAVLAGHLAQAIILPPGCRKPSVKDALAPVPPHLCSNSFGGLHVICGVYPWRLAADACASFGLRLADLHDDNVLYARDLLRHCAFTANLWIAAFNGLNAEPAMQFNRDAVVVRGDYDYNEDKWQVLCQDIPVDTVTTSLTTTTTISTSIRYTCTTTTVKPTHCHHDEHKSNTNNNGDNLAKSCPPNRMTCRRPNQTTCNCCSDACPVGFDGLHIVYGELMSFGEARVACARHGWHLADYLSGMTSALTANLISQCDLDPLDVQLWVRSFEGVSGGDCVAVALKDHHFYAGYGLSDAFCTPNREGSVAALCQERPPLLTGDGPYQGRFTTTTTSVVSTAYVDVPASTETITFTVTRRHRRHHHRHHHHSHSHQSSTSHDIDDSSW